MFLHAKQLNSGEEHVDSMGADNRPPDKLPTHNANQLSLNVDHGTGLNYPPSVTTSALQVGRQFVTTSRTMSPSTTWVTLLFSHQIVFTKDTSIVTLTWCLSQPNYLQGQPLALLLIN